MSSVSVLSKPVTVKVEPVAEVLKRLSMFHDTESCPYVHALEQGQIQNPNLGKELNVSLYSFSQVCYHDVLAEKIAKKKLRPAEPDVLFSLMLALSGDQKETADLRREFMAQRKTLLCLPTTFVQNTGQVHVTVGQNPCEHKRGQRPWAIQYLVRQLRIPSLYDVVAVSTT